MSLNSNCGVCGTFCKQVWSIPIILCVTLRDIPRVIFNWSDCKFILLWYVLRIVCWIRAQWVQNPVSHHDPQLPLGSQTGAGMSHSQGGSSATGIQWCTASILGDSRFPSVPVAASCLLEDTRTSSPLKQIRLKTVWYNIQKMWDTKYRWKNGKTYGLRSILRVKWIRDLMGRSLS